jgi:hypothetical protein
MLTLIPTERSSGALRFLLSEWEMA